jgi:hypothetical protein
MPDDVTPLKDSQSDVWEAISVLTEQVNDLVLQVSAIQIALVKTSPSFALEYDRAYTDAVSEQEKCESEEAPNVREEFRRLRRKRT